MGAKQSRLSDQDFLFLEEETGMSKATLQVEKFRPSVQSPNFVHIYRCGTPTSWKTAQVESSLRRNSSKFMLYWQKSSQGNISHVNIWCSSMFWNRVYWDILRQTLISWYLAFGRIDISTWQKRTGKNQDSRYCTQSGKSSFTWVSPPPHNVLK